MIDQNGRVDRAETVKVAVRCRPLSDAESKAGCHIAVNLDAQNKQVSVVEQRGGARTSHSVFTFDAVFAVDATQLEVILPAFHCHRNLSVMQSLSLWCYRCTTQQ